VTPAVAPDDTWTVPSSDDLHKLLAERAHANVGVVAGVIDSTGARVVSYGRTGAHDDRTLDGETIFQIGSVTKTITTLLLADMVVRGEVNLDDPAEDYLPDGVTMPKGSRPITLRDLATHRSGLPSMPTNFDIHGDPDPVEAYSVAQLHEFLSTYTLPREPGAQYSYSNLGVALLGRLLARHAGMGYEELLRERVLGPLKMNSTSIALSEARQNRLAPGHDRYLQPVLTMEMTTLPGSGSLRSSASDMLQLLAAYLGHDDSSLSAAMALQLNEGLGWFTGEDGVVLHSGGKAGYRSGVAFDLRTGVGAVVLANAYTDDQPLDLALHLVTGEALQPAPPTPVKRRIELSIALLDGYAGRYQSGTNELEVARNGSRLLLRYPNGNILEFVATAEREFFYHGGNDDIAFEFEGSGQVSGLILYGDGKEAGTGDLYRRVE
jgi:CubicO group peptidase (beta-lactamase class C family)